MITLRQRWVWVVALLLACTAQAPGDSITLINGDVLRGLIVSERDGFVVLLHPDLGRLTILRRKIDSIDRTRDVLPEPDAVAPPDSDDAASDDASDTPPAPDADGATPETGETPEYDGRRFGIGEGGDWRLSLSLGSVISNDEEGEKLSYNSEFTAQQIRATGENLFRASYYFKLDDGEVDDHEATILGERRFRRLGSDWYTGVRPRYDFDEFRSWRHRLQVHVAQGYFFVDEAHLRWSVEAGAGYRKDWGSEDEPDVFEGLLGTGVDWTIDEGQHFTLDMKYYPELTDSEQRLVTRIDWEALIAKRAGMSVTFSLEHEYATDPDPGFPRNNLRASTGIKLEF